MQQEHSFLYLSLVSDILFYLSWKKENSHLYLHKTALFFVEIHFTRIW